MDFPGVKQANICLGQWISHFSHVLREHHLCDFDCFSHFENHSFRVFAYEDSSNTRSFLDCKPLATGQLWLTLKRRAIWKDNLPLDQISLSDRVVHRFLLYVMYPILSSLNHSPNCHLHQLFHISLPYLVPSISPLVSLFFFLIKKKNALLRTYTIRPQIFL